MSRGLFRDVDAALSFAFAMEGTAPSVAGTLGRANDCRPTFGHGLTSAEWRAQAAAMLRWVRSELPRDGQTYLAAFYAIGDAKDDARRQLLALRSLTNCCRDLATTAAILWRYTAPEHEREPLRSIAKRLGVAHTTVMRTEYRLKAALSAHFATSEAAIWAHFEACGWTDARD